MSAELADALRDPRTYGVPGAVEVHETHVSWVFLAGEDAYKVKKPVTLAFLDYGSLARRREACHEEVRLNRRLAPDLYLGVRAVVTTADGVRLAGADDPDAVEYAVHMRRFAESDTLAARIGAGSASAADLDALGARLAAFHAGAANAQPASGAEAVKRTLDDTFASLRTLAPEEGAALARAERAAAAQLTRHWEELDARARRGCVREGHGDLRAEHVLLDGTPRVVDCIEFDRDLREIDTALDLAFLVMDLHRLDRPGLAEAAVAGYRREGGDPGEDALLALLASHRAQVRAKVGYVRAAQLDGDAADAEREGARALLALGERLLWRSRAPLVVAVAGIAASGKSTLAAALGEASGFPVLSSDVLRKRALGLEATERAPVEAYHDLRDRETYAALVAEARRLSEHGGVIVDATFRRRWQRDALREAARGRRRLVVECGAPEAVLLERARRRARGARISDADAGIVGEQLRDAEPFDEVPAAQHLRLRTDAPVGSLVAVIADALDRTG